MTRRLTTEEVRSFVLSPNQGGRFEGWTEAEFDAWLDEVQSDWHDAGFEMYVEETK